MWKLLPQQMRRSSLYLLYQPVYAILWVYLNHQMHMVWHDLHSLNFRLQLGSHITNDLPETFIYLINQHRTAVLRAPNDMIDA